MKKNPYQNLPVDQLEKSLNAVELSEDLLHFFERSRLLHNLSTFSHAAFGALSILEKFVPVVKLVLSGIMTVSLSAKYFKKFQTKKATPRRVASSVVNLTVPIAVVGLAIAAIAVPMLLPVLTLATIALGAAREIFNFAKTVYSQYQSHQHIKKLSKQISEGADKLKPEQLTALKKDHLEALFKHKVRSWKIVNRSADLAIGLLSIACVAVVLATGPFGWIALAGVGVIGLAIKIGLTITKKYRLNDLRRTELKKAPVPNQPDDSNDKLDKEHLANTKDLLDDMKKHPSAHAEVYEQPSEGEGEDEGEGEGENDIETLTKEQGKIFTRVANDNNHPEFKPANTVSITSDKDSDESQSEGEGEGEDEGGREALKF